ncbi:MAG: photosynthetic complex putative assembly protein PuhB [Hyphomicrobium sp.]
MSEDYGYEPIRGLPGDLPEGEKLLWQGAPKWTTLARTVFHAGLVAVYFLILIAWRIGSTLWTGGDVTTAALSASWLAVTGAVALGIIALLAWMTARTTVYSITSRRVAMRFGAALPLTINLPYSAIVSADLKHNRDGTGDIALALTNNGKLAYFHLWPHARPWHVSKTQPMMRALPEPLAVANLLSSALAAAHPDGSRSIARAETAPDMAANSAASPAALGATG